MNCMEPIENETTCEHCGYNEEEEYTIQLKPGTILADQYIVGTVLGHGGFGITYIGFDKNLHRKIAIKEYYPTAFAYRKETESTVNHLKGDNEEFFYHGLKLFINEARNLARFNHNINIVNINYYFEDKNTAYMVMDLLEGGDLSNHISKRGGKLSVEESLHIIFPILDALKELHSNKLYHLDISPQNILFNPNDIPILIDFGAAKQVIGEQSRSMDVIIKPGYSPMEQYTSSGKLGPWADIYACGATLYKMITGKTPPPAPDRLYKDDLIQLSDIKSLNIPSGLNDAVLHALAVRHEDRFQNIQEFTDALAKGIKTSRYETYSSMLENFLQKKNILLGERIFLDRFIHEHHLNYNEVCEIEKKIRKKQRTPSLDWEREYKENYELLLKHDPSGIPKREKKKLRETYIDSKRISEKKVQKATKKLKVKYSKKKNAKKKRLAFSIGVLLGVAALIAALFIFSDIPDIPDIPVKPTQKVYTITASSGNNGSIEPSGNIAVNERGSQSFKIKPDMGYEMDKLLVDERKVEPDTPYTYKFKSVGADQKIHVTFNMIKYKVTARSKGQGTIYPSDISVAHAGESKEFIMEAYKGYELADITVNNLSVRVNSVYIISDINEDYEITAAFKKRRPLSIQPMKPKLEWPENKQKNISVTPAFKTSEFRDPNPDDKHSWSELQISTENNFPVVTALIKTPPDDLTSFTPLSKLNAGTEYYWRVKYADNRATVSNWSDIHMFTTKTMRPGEIIPSCDSITWEDVQRLLAKLDLYPKDAIDGLYGQYTEKAIIKFQEYYHLEPTGRLDNETCAKLKRHLE
ncbi:MAG: protein kinase [Desulfobacterales bacterium]|nr:protein kinase [Desulfobacterales bacterium]